jgi:hypothetical protein
MAITNSRPEVKIGSAAAFQPIFTGGRFKRLKAITGCFSKEACILNEEFMMILTV